jgi:purine-binding chemotaxis protein CheW
MRLLTFQVADQSFALPADDVRELLRAVEITALPKAAPLIEGIIDVRGQIVPVLEIRSRFKLPPKSLEPSDHLVVAMAGARVVALRVDRACDLVDAANDAISSVSSHVPSARHVDGVAQLADGLVVIYDLATFLTAAESDSLDLALAEPRA